MSRYDVIVLGAGGVGSAALYHAARRGLNALAIDRHQPPHDKGSSHGQTRIIRQAYFEHPDYVPLVLRAYELWRELEQASGRELLSICGLLQVGPAAGVVVKGVRDSAARHDLAIENLTADEAMRRFPGTLLPSDWTAVFEPSAGYLHVEACVEAHLTLAQNLGAELVCHQAVRGWRANAGGVTVEADGQAWYADRLIITAGPWAAWLLTGVGVPLMVRRKPLFWFATQGDRYRQDRGFPCFLFERPEGIFYGFPELSSSAGPGGQLKFAEHTGGQTVADPAFVDRQLDGQERRRVEHALGQHLPGVTRQMTEHRVCMYTMTPDENFLVDRVPGVPQAVFAAGLSGHGFKFASVLGEALVDLAITGASPLPIAFLGLDRPGLK